MTGELPEPGDVIGSRLPDGTMEVREYQPDLLLMECLECGLLVRTLEEAERHVDRELVDWLTRNPDLTEDDWDDPHGGWEVIRFTAAEISGFNKEAR